MDNKKTELSISTEVLEKMAAIAAKEIDGVVDLSKKAVDIKGAIKTKSAFKGVKVESINGAIEITVFICVKQTAKVREVAEAVQRNVKDKLQNMAGTAVTKVNVTVSDILIEEEKAE